MRAKYVKQLFYGRKPPKDNSGIPYFLYLPELHKIFCFPHFDTPPARSGRGAFSLLVAGEWHAQVCRRPPPKAVAVRSRRPLSGVGIYRFRNRWRAVQSAPPTISLIVQPVGLFLSLSLCTEMGLDSLSMWSRAPSPRGEGGGSGDSSAFHFAVDPLRCENGKKKDDQSLLGLIAFRDSRTADEARELSAPWRRGNGCP